jgi:hypothetical protein
VTDANGTGSALDAGVATGPEVDDSLAVRLERIRAYRVAEQLAAAQKLKAERYEVMLSDIRESAAEARHAFESLAPLSETDLKVEDAQNKLMDLQRRLAAAHEENGSGLVG